jgi:hypothetical protein
MGDDTLSPMRWLQAGTEDQIAHVVDMFGGETDEQEERVYSGNEKDYSEDHELVRAR